MSRKYDFGYELEAGSTNEWAVAQIAPRSKVLELGSAVGNVTKHLKEMKNCIVDIVEIDVESGTIASQFARRALIGLTDGNLNLDIWYKKICGEKYDYVVILDVLEHLDDPEQTLKFLKNLSKDDGKIVTSIPNIANNAVLINLYNDKFEYTKLGLLDRTHRFFWTEKTIFEVMERVGYNIDTLDAIMKEVGTTEIVNTYEDVPEEMAYCLKERKLGDVYQYLLVLSTEEKGTVNLIEQKEKKGTAVKSVILFNGLYDNHLEFSNNEGKIVFRIPMQDGIESVRLFPTEHACVVKNFTCYAYKKDTRIKIEPNWITGVKQDDGSFVFGIDEQAINLILEEHANELEISFECYLLYNRMMPYIDSCLQTVKEVNRIVESKELVIQEHQEKATTQNMLLEEMAKKLNDTTLQLEKSEAELSLLKSTFWYKLYTKMQKNRRK